MDNNAFETEMINTVNKKADAHASKLNALWAEAIARSEKRRKAKRILAGFEVFCWVFANIVIGGAMGILNSRGVAPDGLAIAIVIGFGLLSGIRMGGLLRLIHTI